MKIKIGTQIEENLYHDLKVAAVREKRAIGDVIQEAIAPCLREKSSSGVESSGLGRLLEADPLRLTPEQILKSMDADCFDQ